MHRHGSYRSVFYFLLTAALILSACTAEPAVVITLPAPTVAPTAAETAPPTNVPNLLQPANTTAPLLLTTPGDPPVQPADAEADGIAFDYHAVPFGKPLETLINGRTVSIRVSKVTLGNDADVIALAKAPEEMQWVIIQLSIKYVKGVGQQREQLLEPDMFEIVSKGHLSTGQPLFSYTPSPHLKDVKLRPGEESLGYLAYQAYRDDPTPLLRLELKEQEHFFQLTRTVPEPVLPGQGYDLAEETGTAAQPVPLNTPTYVRYGSSVYRITVQKTLRGFDAWKKISDGWGINKEPPLSQEYIMPFLSVQLVSASSRMTRFYAGTLSSYSNRVKDTQPYNFFCPLPCFDSADLYPNGTASGWVPLLAYKDDSAPLLVFDNRLYFSLVSEEAAAAPLRRTLSPKAIGYDRRNQIHQILEVKQVGPVYALGFTPDDRYLLTGGDDKKIHIWQIETGQEIATLKGHVGSVKGFAFSPDNKLMVSTAASPEILVWDTDSWQLVTKLVSKGMGSGLKFLSDGTLLSINAGGYLTYWDVTTGKITRSGVVPRNMNPACSGSPLYSFDSSDDGNLLAASLACGFAVIWKRDSGEIVFSDFNRQDDLRNRRAPVSSAVALSPDGREAAYGMVYYPNRRLMLMDIIDVEKKKIVASVNPMNPDLFAARVAPNNDLILAGVGSTVTVWWPEAYVWGSDNLVQLSGHSGVVTALQFSNSGELLASGDYNGKTILWTGQ